MILKKILIAVFSVLMFLPCVFIGTNALYYGFNHEATSQTYTKEEPTYYQTNEVTSYESVIVGNIYHYNANAEVAVFSGYTYLKVKYTSNLNNQLGVPVGANNLRLIYYTSEYPYPTLQYDFGGSPYYIGVLNKACDLVFEDLAYASAFPTVFFDNLTSSTLLIPNGTKEVTYTNGIVDSLVEATDRTFELPLFNWATDNDTHAVLETVGSYMDIDSDNAVLSLLNYWLCVGGLFLVVYAVCLLPMYTLGFMDR